MAAGLASDYLQFRKDEYITNFKEALDEFAELLPLSILFGEIVEVLQEKTITPLTPIAAKKWLYDLKFALERCVQLAEQERERTLQNKKSQLDLQSLKKVFCLRKIKKKLCRIKQELQRMSDFADGKTSWLESVRLPVCSGWDASALKFNLSEVHGFDDQLQKLESLLCKTTDHDDGGTKAIGIVGMGGVGKTTLAQMFVAACPNFSPRIWVSLSPNANPPQVVAHMLQQFRPNPQRQQVNDAEDAADLSLQLRELHDQLSGTRYLIVLDGVWHPNRWYSDHLLHALPVGSGGAIIVTTRFAEVARSMVGEQRLLRIEPSFDEKAICSMFMDSIERKTFLDSDHHQVLSRMMDEIICNCHGLPLAAKTLAEVISVRLGEDLDWSDPNVKKEFCLRLKADDATCSKVINKLKTLPGVSNADAGPGSQEITVEGSLNRAKRASELGNYWHTELISVHASDNYSQRRLVLKVYLHSDKEGQEFMKQVAAFSGVESAYLDTSSSKMSVWGMFDVVELVSKIRTYYKYYKFEILSIKWEN